MNNIYPEYLSEHDATLQDDSARAICPGRGQVQPERNMQTCVKPLDSDFRRL